MNPIPGSSKDNSERILTHTTAWFERYLNHCGRRKTYELGKLAIGLEIETQARIFEALSGTSLVALNKEEISTALRSLLRSLGIDDFVLDMYDRLIEYADSVNSKPAVSSSDDEDHYEDA